MRRDGGGAPGENWVGKAVPRLEDHALLTGRARFMDDLEPCAGLRHAAILRSPHAHADIISIDVSKAEKLEGVLGVLTPNDVAALCRPIGNLLTRKLKYYPSAISRVRYFGEPVAVVVATSRYVAEDALDLIDVVYRPRPAVIDPERAGADDATVLHDDLGTNVIHRREFVYGEPDAAFAQAHRVVSVKVPYPRINSTPIETYGVIADYDSGSGRYTVWSNFQGPFALHPVMCDALGVKSHQLRLIQAPWSGGSFGIKHGVYPYIVLIGLASRRFSCPVKWIEDRIEHLAASSASSGRVTSIDGAFAQDGTLLALRLKQLENVGAYLRPPDPAALYRMHSTLSGPYRVRHIAVDNTVVVTNQVPSGLNRGFGGPQFYYPLERLLDQAGKVLGLDPADMRRRNIVRADEFPYESAAGSVLDSGNYEACLDRALCQIGYDDLRGQQIEARAQGRLLGLGIGLSVETSASNMAYVNLALSAEERAKGLPKSGAGAVARLVMDPLGSVIVHIDSVPNGQGHKTVVAQIVADKLGLTPEDIEVVTDLDTLNGPWSITSGNYSNRFSATVTSAVAIAARQAADSIKLAAARMLDAPAERVLLSGGFASAPGARNEPIRIRRIAAQLHWDSSNLPDGVAGPIAETAQFSPSMLTVPDAQDRMRSSLTYSFQCDVAAVEVDKATGRVHVLRYVTVHDAGNMLNPALVEGQIRGGFAHGFGAGMMERVFYGADGTLLSSTFQDYLCPTAPELPNLEISHFLSPSPNNLLGAKGLGDGSSMITPVVLANAISDATGLDNIIPPFTPSRIWEWLNNRDPDAVPAGNAFTTGSLKAAPGGLSGEGNVTIDRPPSEVWAALLDPESLRQTIPGCESVALAGDNEYRARVRISVAGIGATYEVTLRVFDLQAPERLRLAGRGESRLGFGEGEAAVTLTLREDGQTQLSYTYVAAVGGKLAGVGNRMLDGVVHVLIGAFFDRFGAHLRGEHRGALRQRFRNALAMLRVLLRGR